MGALYGALAQCQTLDLGYNQIGDPGLASLADVCARGALPSLKYLWIDAKYRRHPALVAACQPRGIQIS